MTIECSRCGGNHMRSECPTLDVAQTKSSHIEHTEAGTIDWNMEVERLNRLLVAAELKQQPALGEQERHAVEHARWQVEHATPENPDCCFDYQLVETLVGIIDRLSSVSSTHRAPSLDESPVLEVWNGDRKVTVYEKEVMRIWGPHMEDEMCSDQRDHETVAAAFDWLYADGPSTVTSKQCGEK